MTEYEYDQMIDQVNEDNDPRNDTHKVFYIPVGSDHLELIMQGTFEECEGFSEVIPHSFIVEINSITR